MKTLTVLSLMLAVVLGRPPLPPNQPPNTVLLEEPQRPLVADWVPVQGHVEVEDPEPQPRLSSTDEQKKQAAVDMKQSQSVVELEVKEEPEVKPQTEEEVKLKPEVTTEDMFQADQGVKEPDGEKVEVEMVPELKADQEFKVESEVKVEPDAEVLLLNELQERAEDQMQLETDPEAGAMTEEQYINTEEEFESKDEPVEAEPMDDDNMFAEEVSDTEEMSDVEKALRATFLSQDNEPEQLQYEGGAEAGVEGRTSSKEAAQGRSNCPGVELDGKCYQYFREPKRAEDAELFCQTLSTRGHLAAITTEYVHRELMKMMLRLNGRYTRTWVGGLRYLETGRFVWLDGSHWGYADWLPGEPNHTANLENCLELLPHGNGLFNDFTCWEPQPFICSY